MSVMIEFDPAIKQEQVIAAAVSHFSTFDEDVKVVSSGAGWVLLQDDEDNATFTFNGKTFKFKHSGYEL